MKKQIIIADANCKQCHGIGTVYDSVPWGSTYTLMPSYCSCIEEQIADDAEEIEVVPAFTEEKAMVNDEI